MAPFFTNSKKVSAPPTKILSSRGTIVSKMRKKVVKSLLTQKSAISQDNALFASKAKINVFWIFYSNGAAALKWSFEKISKTVYFSFWGNCATTQTHIWNCTFFNFNTMWSLKSAQYSDLIHFVLIITLLIFGVAKWPQSNNVQPTSTFLFPEFRSK